MAVSSRDCCFSLNQLPLLHLKNVAWAALHQRHGMHETQQWLSHMPCANLCLPIRTKTCNSI